MKKKDYNEDICCRTRVRPPGYPGSLSARQVLASCLIMLCSTCAQANPAAPAFSWLNQTQGPRPAFVWENREDVIYHDLSYPKPEVETAPEIAPFMGRAWVFNKAMQWRRCPEGILCYSAPATLPLTGDKAVSAWHSDPANEIQSEGAWTTFTKRSTIRRRDCALLPAFQFHVGQNPTVALTVDRVSTDWQFVVSVKGRSGAPLLASDWQSGPGHVTFNLAEALHAKGFDLNYAELHFVIGLWTDKPDTSASIRYRLIMPGQAAVVASLPVVRTARQARESGVPLLAMVLDEHGDRLAKEDVEVSAEILGLPRALQEQDGIWQARVVDLPEGDHAAKIRSQGKVTGQTQLSLRITDGVFWRYDPTLGLFRRGDRPLGPLTGSNQGNVFARDVGWPGESLVQGQAAWDQWDRSRSPGEHLFYWEALTSREMDERFGYLKSCGWDLLHVCQHWGIWERLDAGGRIAPHGAEQIALYLRTAGRHDLAVIQALTHYEYAAVRIGWHGTVPFTRYLDVELHNDDFFQPGRNPAFDEMFHRYLLDYVTLFKGETALFAMTASGEGDATIGHARAHDVFDFVRSHDAHHVFMGEPTHLLHKVPRAYTAGWRQDLFGGRTYAIANDFLPEYDLGVEMKLYQLGGLAMAEGSWGMSNLYAAFHRHVLGEAGWPAESWIGTERYRIRLRDSMYLGLVHRLPKMMTWDEQIAEDEHRLIPVIRRHVDWTQPFQVPPIAVRLESDEIGTDRRRKLIQYETAFAHLGLSYRLLHHDDPVPPGVEIVFDAAKPFSKLAFVADEGTIPDRYKAQRPVTASEGYALNAIRSLDGKTLLAYVYNVMDHYEQNLWLSGRFHRRPKPRDLTVHVQNLPAESLRLRVYDLNEQRLKTEESIVGEHTVKFDRTSHDYVVVVTPQ